MLIVLKVKVHLFSYNIPAQALCCLAPPCPFNLPSPSYYDVDQAWSYFVFTVSHLLNANIPYM